MFIRRRVTNINTELAMDLKKEINILSKHDQNVKVTIAERMLITYNKLRDSHPSARDIIMFSTVDDVNYQHMEFDKDSFVKGMCNKLMLNPEDVNYMQCCYLLASINYYGSVSAYKVYDVPKIVKSFAMEICDMFYHSQGTLTSFLADSGAMMLYGTYALFNDVDNNTQRFEEVIRYGWEEWLESYVSRVLNSTSINYCKPFNRLFYRYTVDCTTMWWVNILKEKLDKYDPEYKDMDLYSRSLLALKKRSNVEDVDYCECLNVERFYAKLPRVAELCIGLEHIVKAVINVQGWRLDGDVLVDERYYEELILIATYYALLPGRYYHYELDKMIDRV